MNQNHFYSLDTYLKETFGEKVYRISLNGGMTCPNRDGTKGTRGCIFCSRGGSGDFAENHLLSVSEQIASGQKKLAAKTKCRKFIAYFQAYTNTYAPVSYLRRFFWKRSGIQTLLYYPSPQDRTVSMMKSSHCCPN